MTNRYGRALDWLAASGKEMWDNPWHPDTAQVHAINRKDDVYFEDPRNLEGVHGEARVGAALMLHGTPYYLEQHIQDAMKGTVDTLPADFRMTNDLAPCPFGVLYLERPLSIDDISGAEEAALMRRVIDEPWAGKDKEGEAAQAHAPEPVYLRAIGWKLANVAYNEQTFVNPGEGNLVFADDPAYDEVASLNPDLELAAGVVCFLFYENARGRISSMTFHAENFIGGSHGYTDRYGARWLMAAWTFLQQELLVEREAPLDRATRRRLERAPKIAQEQAAAFRVLYLRRPKSLGGGGSGEAREWDCSWVVSGHWRNQACGEGMKNHRLRWIFPYVKGDLDKPLKADAKRIYAVAR